MPRQLLFVIFLVKLVLQFLGFRLTPADTVYLLTRSFEICFESYENKRGTEQSTNKIK